MGTTAERGCDSYDDIMGCHGMYDQQDQLSTIWTPSLSLAFCRTFELEPPNMFVRLMLHDVTEFLPRSHT